MWPWSTERPNATVCPATARSVESTAGSVRKAISHAGDSVAANEWMQLAQSWQDAARQWSEWWTRASGVPATAQGATLGNPALALPVMQPAWIDPAAATELTERYQHRFEELWSRIVTGGNEGEESAKDRRFTAREWREQPYFALLKEAYLLHASYVRELVDLAQADPATKKRLVFLAHQYVDAISPSNFLPTNPEALKLALESGGASVAQGLSNLIADAQRGRIAMTDESAFEVGSNLAITPGSVVFRNELIELIQYDAATAQVHRRPLLIVPPCINKYYILALRPENSFIKYAVDQGHTVFVISWRNIPQQLGTLGWDDYLEQGVFAAIDVVREVSASQTLHALGFCVGGTMLAGALAVLAARREAPVAS